MLQESYSCCSKIVLVESSIFYYVNICPPPFVFPSYPLGIMIWNKKANHKSTLPYDASIQITTFLAEWLLRGRFLKMYFSYCYVRYLPLPIAVSPTPEIVVWTNMNHHGFLHRKEFWQFIIGKVILVITHVKNWWKRRWKLLINWKFIWLIIIFSMHCLP